MTPLCVIVAVLIAADVVLVAALCRLNGRLSETDETDETDEAPHPSRCACHLPPRGKA